MRWLLRSLVFAVCMAAGLYVASLTASMDFQQADYGTVAVAGSEGVNNARPASPGGVRVEYSGFLSGTEDGTQFLKFTVHNDGSWPISYGAHTSEDPFPVVHVNGRRLDGLGRCGTGMRDFFILPGGSAEFRVASYELRRRPNPGDNVQIGFYLRPLLSEDATPHLSAPLQLPAAFVNAIKEYEHAADQD